MGRPKKNTRDYKAIAEKRKAALIARYGSWEAYLAHWQHKRQATIQTTIGDEGYRQIMREAGALGGTNKGLNNKKRQAS